MLRMSLILPTAATVALWIAMPAFAQGSMSGSSASPASSPAETSAMTCDQIMDKVHSLSISATGASMAMKQNEMVAARAAKARNDEAGCKAHATKALQLML